MRQSFHQVRQITKCKTAKENLKPEVETLFLTLRFGPPALLRNRINLIVVESTKTFHESRDNPVCMSRLLATDTVDSRLAPASRLPGEFTGICVQRIALAK